MTCDFNAAPGKQGGPRGFGVINTRGRKLIEFLEYFNLVAINLFELTEGPLHSYVSDGERHKSMIDYIVLPCFVYRKSKFMCCWEVAARFNVRPCTNYSKFE